MLGIRIRQAGCRAQSPLQGQPPKRQTSRDNPVTRGRVTTATPAKLDFKPPVTGGVEGCADAMSAKSRGSIDLQAHNGNPAWTIRKRCHPHGARQAACASGGVFPSVTDIGAKGEAMDGEATVFKVWQFHS
jgi:hypothetical protein